MEEIKKLLLDHFNRYIRFSNNKINEFKEKCNDSPTHAMIWLGGQHNCTGAIMNISNVAKANAMRKKYIIFQEAITIIEDK